MPEEDVDGKTEFPLAAEAKGSGLPEAGTAAANGVAELFVLELPAEVGAEVKILGAGAPKMLLCCCTTDVPQKEQTLVRRV